MPAGTMYRSKKKVFTNKSLTRQVRALKGTEGRLVTGNDHLYNAHTLTANTGVIEYIDNVPGTTENARYKHLRMFVDIRAQAATDVVRMCIIKDNDFHAAAITPSDFIDNSQPNGAYKSTGDVAFKISSKNKNWAAQPRIEVVKDYLLGFDTSRLYRSMIIDVPLHNAKLQGVSKYAIYFQSSATTTVDVWTNVLYTNLQN